MLAIAKYTKGMSWQASPAEDATRLEEVVRSKLPPTFDHIPEGWPGGAELALIDAVLSIRAVYGKSSKTGVRRRIGLYKAGPSPESWCKSSLDRVTLRGAV